MVFTSNSPAETESIGEIVARTLKAGSVVILKGAIGSGKTVFTKGIAKSLGITEVITSPSYTISAEYRGDVLLRHIDLYRTDSDEELELLGFDELSGGPAVAVIEWGEKAAHFLPDPDVIVEFEILAGEKRVITVAGIRDEKKRTIACQ
ncbi:MAG: tRNA (adenosine(37)-N6)-threonylcarbamoyltransferase complex ATPase subunit type 1 TsaE [Spirochaetales bacterium]|nr:tRNA (adenosine(37)-N6)-threonylcarbamoyltransferase complex ATPase subunit type 1 TsaE [Spirochaetales bacterium]